ncbi:hypothetical protein MAHJHV51_47640 [Mycobacterium avium subsp. hominissuis]
MTAVPYPDLPFLKGSPVKRHAAEYDRIVHLHSQLIRRNTAKDDLNGTNKYTYKTSLLNEQSCLLEF